MVALVGPFAAGSVLLAVAGAPKIAQPDSTTKAFGDVVRPLPSIWFRAFGAVELVIGVAALLTSNRVVAAAVAVSYFAFAVFITLALRGPGIESCGCFAEEAPPGVAHLALNVAFGAVALAVAIIGAPSLLDVAKEATGRGVLLTVVVAVQAWLAYLLLTRLPMRATA
jgi:uncharacterized membrane protein YphA (DoxX/SURF4 family)